MPVDQALPWLTGPYAALVLALLVIWGLWRLYQQERAERRQNFDALKELTYSVRALTESLRPMSKRR